MKAAKAPVAVTVPVIFCFIVSALVLLLLVFRNPQASFSESQDEDDDFAVKIQSAASSNTKRYDPSPDGAPLRPGELRYRPQRRYEPSVFNKGMDFSKYKGKTPLSVIRNGEAGKPAVPPDWDGGYGWLFVKYHPSPFESRWRQAAKPLDGRPGMPLCHLLKSKFRKELDVYLANLNRMPSNDGGKTQCDISAKMNASIEAGQDLAFQQFFSSEPLEFDPEVFSRFEYVYKCTLPPCHTGPPANGPKVGARKFTYIEPLVGLLRHPGVCLDNRYEVVINKNYMLIDPWSLVNPSRSTISPKPRVLYFDGGASTWDQGAGGASQSWFYRIYDAICVHFEAFFMWEAGGHDAKGIFRLIPGHLRPGYRWFNIPLTVTPEHWDNPMNHLLVEAKKEDIVIFKIDFDTPLIEMALIQQILDYPEVAELIDEMYFEHHVNHEVLSNYWGTRGLKVYNSDSINLFTSLREKGVRAHSWV